MKPEMLQSIERRFADIEQEELLVLATMMDPGFKDKFFSDAVNWRNADDILPDKCVKMRGMILATAQLSLHPKGLQMIKVQVICGVVYQKYCLKHQLYLMKVMIPTVFHACEVEKYLAEPLLEFKGNSPFKWWAADRNAYILLCELARK